MPVLQDAHIEGLSPLIFAFEGHPTKTKETHLIEGEKHNEEFKKLIYDGRDNNLPKQFHEGLRVTNAEIAKYKIDKGNPFRLKCFLWVIDEISIKILWEMTSNVKRGEHIPEKPFVCHTNITGENGKAYIGGEMYFCEENKIYINFHSDRFGTVATPEKKKMALKYMNDCKYVNIINTEDSL